MKTTMRDLEAQVRRLNIMTDSPLETYKKEDGKFIAQIGNYHLDGAYGGWKLSRICSEGGAVTDVLHCGFVSKRELSNLISAYERGIEVHNDKA